MNRRRPEWRTAWCCAHYPTHCDTHGWTDTEPQATAAAYAHFRGFHL